MLRKMVKSQRQLDSNTWDHAGNKKITAIQVTVGKLAD
jgi:hypothetical protein